MVARSSGGRARRDDWVGILGGVERLVFRIIEGTWVSWGKMEEKSERNSDWFRKITWLPVAELFLPDFNTGWRGLFVWEVGRQTY